MTTNTSIQELKSSIASSHYNLLMHILHGRKDPAQQEFAELQMRRAQLEQVREEFATKLRDLDDTIEMIKGLVAALPVQA